MRLGLRLTRDGGQSAAKSRGICSATIRRSGPAPQKRATSSQKRTA